MSNCFGSLESEPVKENAETIADVEEAQPEVEEAQPEVDQNIVTADVTLNVTSPTQSKPT